MGASFWIVIKIMAWGHIIPSITCGNHKWKGAAPIFKIKASKIKIKAIFWNIIIKQLLMIIIDDPRAWIRKYLIAASEIVFSGLDEIKGINDIKFNSKPTQAVNQDVEEIAMNEPVIKEEINIILIGIRNIKKRKI